MYTYKSTYIDYDGNERTETARFNLNKAEIAELELTTEGGIENTYNKIMESKNQAEIIRQFKKILMLAYGEKSDDGRYFMKSPELSHKFTCSPLYPELFMKLSTDAEFAATFWNKIMPEDMVAAAQNKVVSIDA